MNETVKVSVLIAAYNGEKYIDQCLESAMNQTLREIEIIVVDDCSTDGTLAHIEAAAEKDSRVRVIRHEENRGTLQSRRDAVLASRGGYVMFMDGDDYLALDACRTVYENAIKSDTDILQFGVSDENCGDLPMKNIEGLNRSHNRYQDMEFLGQPLVRNCTERRISVTVWQKAIKGETAKRAFKKMSTAHMDASQDEYITCILLMESRSLSKIPDKLYHYCYGRGVYGHQTLTLQEYSFHCKGVIAYNELKKYVSERSSDCGEEYIVAGQDAVEKLKKTAINISLNFLLNHMKPEDQPEAFLMMEKAWQTESVAFADMLTKKIQEVQAQRDQERKKVKNLERKLNSRDRELESVKGSVSFRVGRALTWAPRKVRGLVRCCREHDAKYTFERILFHLHLGPDNEKRGE